MGQSSSGLLLSVKATVPVGQGVAGVVVLPPVKQLVPPEFVTAICRIYGLP